MSSSLRSVAWLLLPAAIGWGQDPAVKSFQVRDKVVELKVAPDLLVVRPKGPAKAADLSAEVVRAQAELLGLDLSKTKLTGDEPRELPLGKGTIVPRLPGIKDVDLGRLAERSPLIKAVEPVYRAGGSVTVPLDTVTVRFRFDRAPPARLVFAITQEFDLQETARPKYAAAAVRFRPNKANTDLFELCQRLKKNANIVWAEPDMIVDFELQPKAVPAVVANHSLPSPRVGTSVSHLPNDPLFDRQWHLANGTAGIQASNAWAIAPAAQPIIVAIVDTGIDRKHPDLVDQLVPGYDALDEDEDPHSRQNAHSTACAGLVGAVANNQTGVAGIAWNCRIMPIRVLGDVGGGPWSSIAEGIAYAARNRAKIISCSLGGGFPSNQVLDAIDLAVDSGSLVFAAAGNHNTAVEFPAAYEKCIAVGAVRADNKKCDYSCFGQSLAIVAPGGHGGDNLPGIWTTDVTGRLGYNPGANVDPSRTPDEPSGDYTGSFDGTSAATPVVAGVAALVWSSYPTLSAQQVRQVLLESATKLEPDSPVWRNGHHVHYGHGKVDALAAMRLAAQRKP